MRVIEIDWRLRVDDESNSSYLKFSSLWVETSTVSTIPYLSSNWEMINIDVNDNWKVIWIEFQPHVDFEID